MEQQVGSVIAAVDDAAAAMAAATAALDANAGLNASDGAAVQVVDTNPGSNVANVRSNGADAGGNLVLKDTKDGTKSDGAPLGKAMPPKVGMSFASLEEAFEFYDNYALEQGFSITRCSSAKGSDGEHRFQTFACHRAGKPRTNGKSCVKRKATAKTNCLARICCSLGSEGRWKINTVVLEHTHPLSPGMPEFLQRSRFRRRIEWYDTGHSLSRNVRGFEIGTENDSRMSHLTKDGTEQTGNENAGFFDGDAQAILRLLLRLQKGSRDFFYAIDSDSGSRLRNAFWGDARSRAAYQEFSDVVLFDTWNLLNRCNIQVALFLGINHHGQLILLGCALLSDDSADTYIWLFREWLSFMSNITPSAIITDQCENIGKAVKSVFPIARHRWCLWHILTKYPEKMNQHKRYDDLKATFLETVYEAINVEEFEEKWAAMIQEYDLHDNDWFLTLYKGREHWLPIFVKQSFWAGMSPIQRNETMPSYFDGCIQPRSTVKQFVDQFEAAMKDKLEKEIESDFRCMSSSISCATAFAVEKQFQVAYAKNIFASVQEEVTKVIYCEADLTKIDGIISEYEVQDKLIAASGATKRQTFGVSYNGETGEVECSCRLFEFKGILCRHAFRVLIKRDIETVPSKYVLRRWRKDIRRCYNKIKTGYVGEDFSVEMKRLRELEKIFYNATDLATESTDKYEFLLKLLQEASNKLEKWNTSVDS